MQISKWSFLIVVWQFGCHSLAQATDSGISLIVTSLNSCLVAPAAVYVSGEVQVHLHCCTAKNLIVRFQNKLPHVCSNTLPIDGQWHRPWRPPSVIHYCSRFSLALSWLALTVPSVIEITTAVWWSGSVERRVPHSPNLRWYKFYRQQVITDMGPRRDRYSMCRNSHRLCYGCSFNEPNLKVMYRWPRSRYIKHHGTVGTFGSAIRPLRYDNNKISFFLFNRYQSIRSWPPFKFHFQIIHT